MLVKNNIMGTVSFILKIGNDRKDSDFIVYPISTKSDIENIPIQSDNRFGYYNPKTGTLILSRKRKGANSIDFSLSQMNGTLLKVVLPESDNNILKEHIKNTAGFDVGVSFVKCDNAGAALI